MPIQHFGRYTALSPNIAIGGFTAAGAVVFNDEPNGITNVAVVSGTLTAVSGTTSKTLTFERSDQLFSYTDNNGDEIFYSASMGGNVVQTGENERGFSFRNSRSFVGSDASDRCEPGDLVWYGGRGFLITSATPFAATPTSTNWGSDAAATVWNFEADINDVALPEPQYNENPAVNVFDTTAGVFGGAVLQIDNTGWEDCTRFIFNRPSDSQPDSFYYPPNAEFSSSPSGGEYWFDPVGQSFRLASGNTAFGDDYRATYWVTGVEDWIALATDEVWGVENTDNATGIPFGTTSTSEEMVILSGREEGNFDRTFRVHKVGGSWSGYNFHMIWRATAETDSAFVSIDIYSGFIEHYHSRTPAGTDTANGNTAISITGDYIDLRMTKSGSVFTLYYTQEGGSEQSYASFSITGVVTESTGWVGIAVSSNDGANFSGFGVGESVQLIRVGAAGQSGVRIDDYQGADWTGVVYSVTVAKKTAEALESVTNVTADILMTVDASDKQRDTYGVSGSDLTFYSESSGDLIKIQEAAPDTPPGGIGRGPQVPNTVNFYDSTDSATAKNHANWRDQVVIHDPSDEFQGIGGDTVDIRRNAIFDSNNPPTLSFSFRDNASSGWTTMTSGTDYIGRWAEGLVLLSATFLAGLAGAEDNLCIRAEGTRILHNGSQTARQFNDMASAIDSFDELWANTMPTGSGLFRMSGTMGRSMGFGPSSVECLSGLSCWRPDDYAWGAQPSSWSIDSTAYPYWDSGSKWFVTESFTHATDNQDCSGDVMNMATLSVPNLYDYFVTPDDTAPGSGPPIIWGSSVDNIGGSASPIGWGITTTFNVEGPVFSWPKIITRLPEGSTCVEAVATVYFEGLIGTRSQLYYERRSITSQSTIENHTVSTNQTSGSVAISVFGFRRNNIQTEDVNGDPITVSDVEFKAFGTGLGTTTEADQWTRHDVTNLVQGLIDNRDSKYPQILLWPGVVPVGSTADDLSGYMLSLIGDYDAGITATDNCTADYFAEADCFSWRCDSFSIGTIFARFRLPDGSLTDVLPIVGTPFMAAP